MLIPCYSVASYNLLTDTNAQLKPAIAYNAEDDEYLVVWEQFSFFGNAVYGRRADGDGTPIGAAFVINWSGTNPAVAYSPMMTLTLSFGKGRSSP